MWYKRWKIKNIACKSNILQSHFVGHLQCFFAVINGSKIVWEKKIPRWGFQPWTKPATELRVSGLWATLTQTPTMQDVKDSWVVKNETEVQAQRWRQTLVKTDTKAKQLGQEESLFRFWVFWDFVLISKKEFVLGLPFDYCTCVYATTVTHSYFRNNSIPLKTNLLLLQAWEVITCIPYHSQWVF